MLSWFMAVALAQEPPETPDETPMEVLVVEGRSLVRQARLEITESLASLGYEEARRRGDFVVYLHEAPWKPRVFVHDDGWMFFRRRGVHFNPPVVEGLGRAGIPLGYALCLINPLACVHLEGLFVTEARLGRQKEMAVDATRDSLADYSDALATRALEGTLQELNAQLDSVWRLGLDPESEAPFGSWSERRAWIAEAWLQPADNAFGDRVRQDIETYALLYVQDSDHPFSREEVASINERRGGARALDLWEGVSVDEYERKRQDMVNGQLRARGIRDPRVLMAMQAVERHLFVPRSRRGMAYGDYPVAIGHDQTISQPYIVALMSELARVETGERVLEVGTGSGYQAAVLAQMGADVYSIEIIEPLGHRAREALEATGYGRVHTRIGDGYRGWPEEAPFGAILVTAAPDHVPAPLKAQLAVGGRMVIPVGSRSQELLVITRTSEGFEEERVVPVRFVPMTGEAEERPPTRGE